MQYRNIAIVRYCDTRLSGSHTILNDWQKCNPGIWLHLVTKKEINWFAYFLNAKTTRNALNKNWTQIIWDAFKVMISGAFVWRPQTCWGSILSHSQNFRVGLKAGEIVIYGKVNAESVKPGCMYTRPPCLFSLHCHLIHNSFDSSHRFWWFSQSFY